MGAPGMGVWGTVMGGEVRAILGVPEWERGSSVVWGEICAELIFPAEAGVWKGGGEGCSVGSCLHPRACVSLIWLSPSPG